MKRLFYTYIALPLLILLLLSFPPRFSEPIRSYTLSLLAPAWKGLHLFKDACLSKINGRESDKLVNEFECLKRDNLLLRSQLDSLHTHIAAEKRLHLNEISSSSLSARVTFREPASWSSSLWIDVGEKNNRDWGKRMIAKNSPVVVGTSLVGVVEWVGEKRSRVRLITDSTLIPSVRVVRGGEQQRILLEMLSLFCSLLEAREDILSINFLKMIAPIRELFEKQEQPTLYLAKGELRGTSQSLWRSRGNRLIGVGFNYDYADEKGGEARDLRTGAPLKTSGKGGAVPLIKQGDILITTGMDGVFPSGLGVAQVTSIGPLREGACSYTLEARALAGDLNMLTFLTVLPPLE